MANADYTDLVAGQRECFLSGATRPTAWRVAQLNAVKAMISENRDAMFDALAHDLRRNHSSRPDGCRVQREGSRLRPRSSARVDEARAGAHPAGQNLGCRGAGISPSSPRSPCNLGLATISRFRAVVSFKGLRLSGFPGWLMWLVVHITFLTGFKNRFTSLLHWANRTGVGSRARTERLTVLRDPGMRTMAAEQDQARRVSSNGSPAWADRTERSHVQQVHAQRVDGQDVHREADARHRAGGGVVVTIAAQGGDPPPGQQRQHRGVQPGPGPGGVPRAPLVAPPPVADPDEHDVARADPDLLIPLGCEHIRHGHVVTRLQPGHAAGPRHVQQHPPADDAVGCQADGQLGRPGRGDGVRGHPVVQRCRRRSRDTGRRRGCRRCRGCSSRSGPC